jgi:hypothetical protein
LGFAAGGVVVLRAATTVFVGRTGGAAAATDAADEADMSQQVRHIRRAAAIVAACRWQSKPVHRDRPRRPVSCDTAGEGPGGVCEARGREVVGASSSNRGREGETEVC